MWKEAAVAWLEELPLHLRGGTEKNRRGLKSGVRAEIWIQDYSNTKEEW
jgi:hypothetical protein